MKLRKILVNLAIVSMIMGTVGFARQIGTLDHFRLGPWQEIQYTNYLTKSISGAPWVINITELSNASSVHTYLCNSYHERRSDYAIVSVGRHEINSFGQAGYNYCALLMNGDSKLFSGYVTGTWSPDNR